MMKKVWATLIGLVLIAAVIAGGYWYMKSQSAPELTAGDLTSRLENASELTTQKLIYRGVVKYEKGKIPVITKDSFLLVYTATVRAGFDASEAEISISDDSIKVVIPEIEIQDINIDPDEIETYSTSLTLIKSNQKEALTEALKLAKQDAKKAAEDTELLEAADENAENLIKSLFADAADGREIIVEHKDGSV